MTPYYHVRHAADRDLDDQAAYLAQEASLETALRFDDASSSMFGKLADMPSLGERPETSNPRLEGLRVWRIERFENHLIFDRPVDDGIEIVRVLHGARDIDSVLESET